MSRYFIDRPIFAWVIAIALMLAGAIAIRSLPIAQFPTIAPPAVTISATYPGADAQTLENTTTQIIEQQMKGIDSLRYFSSSSSSAGSVTMKRAPLISPGLVPAMFSAVRRPPCASAICRLMESPRPEFWPNPSDSGRSV